MRRKRRRGYAWLSGPPPRMNSAHLQRHRLGGRHESGHSVWRKRYTPETIYDDLAKAAHACRVQAGVGAPAEVVTKERNTGDLYYNRVSRAPHPDCLRRRPAMGHAHQLYGGERTSWHNRSAQPDTRLLGQYVPGDQWRRPDRS